MINSRNFGRLSASIIQPGEGRRKVSEIRTLKEVIKMASLKESTYGEILLDKQTRTKPNLCDRFCSLGKPALIAVSVHCSDCRVP